MSSKFEDQTSKLENQLTVQKKEETLSRSMGYENEIYKEAVIIVDLLDQKHIQSIKVIKDKLLIICDYNTDIEPVLIRYGVKAFVKNTAKNIKIAIDVKTIVENKYEE
jgi:vacuolar-type H+-ATPase subunit I/STV1